MMQLLAKMGGGTPDGDDDGKGDEGGPRVQIYGNPSTNLEASVGSMPFAASNDPTEEDDFDVEEEENVDMFVQEQEAAPLLKKKTKRRKNKSKQVAAAAADIEVLSTMPSICSISNIGNSSEQLKVKKKISKQQKAKQKTSTTAAQAVDAIAACEDGSKNLKSLVWQHFNVKYVGKVRVSAHCKHCGMSVPCHSKKNGTSSAKCHAASCSHNPSNDKSQFRQSLLGFQPADLETNTGPSPYLGNWFFDCKAAREAFIKKMIIDADPFCEFQKPGWKLLLAVILPPYFHMPGRSQFTRDCLSMYATLKAELIEVFASTKQRVSLTTDTWTSSNQKINYMCVTAHFIDAAWKLQKRIIYFVPIFSHRGEDLGLVLEECLLEWGLESVFCITMDNASPNDVLARSLRNNLVKWNTAVLGGENLQMRCAAHIINLVVSEGLKENLDSVSKARDTVAYLRRSPARIEKFKEACLKEGIEYTKHLWLDSPTRWNGAYIMLERALHYKRAIARYSITDKQMSKDLKKDGSGLPEEADWVNIARLVKFLKHFCHATKKVSGTWYMTANLYLPEISDMFMKLKKLQRKDPDESVRKMATRMMKKFRKYWGEPKEMNLNLFFSVVFDPRYKFDAVIFILKNLYGRVKAKEHEVMIRRELDRLFKFYLEQNKEKEPSNPTSRSGSCSSKSVTSAPVKSFKAFGMKKKNKSQDPEKTKNELEKYLREDDDEDDNFDLMEWWKAHSPRYPIVSKMAKDILAVPVSSVASECAFSTCGRVLTDFRSSLTPKSVQALICAQDWLYPRTIKMPEVEEKLEMLEMIEGGGEIPERAEDEEDGQSESEEEEEEEESEDSEYSEDEEEEDEDEIEDFTASVS